MSLQDTIKVHAYLAHCGIASRRACEKMIEEGRVTVDGQKAIIGQRVNPLKEIITVDGKAVNQTEELVYYILNKPTGFVSTVKDELDRRTVLDLLPQKQHRLYPVGRLDLESEGLLLLTNDGQLAYTLTHPSFEIRKTYNVLLKGIPSTPALEHLRRGIKLREGYTKPVSVTILRREEPKNTWVEIVIKEGRYQQIRRMMERTGYDVLRLVRVKMGPIELGNLPTGSTRALTDEEIVTLHELSK